MSTREEVFCKVSGIGIDLDGVVLNIIEIVERSYIETCNEVVGFFDPLYFADSPVGKLIPGEWLRIWASAHGYSKNVDELKKVWLKLFKIMECEVQPFPYALESLESLSNHIQVSAITNRKEFTLDALHLKPLWENFTFIFQPHKGYIPKPNPQMCQACAKMYQCPIDNVLMVGDCLEIDGKMSKNAGSPFVLIENGWAGEDDLSIPRVASYSTFKNFVDDFLKIREHK